MYPNEKQCHKSDIYQDLNEVKSIEINVMVGEFARALMHRKKNSDEILYHVPDVSFSKLYNGSASSQKVRCCVLEYPRKTRVEQKLL